MYTRTTLCLDREFEICISDEIDSPLMICSHERSGTHLLMNSLSYCTKYQNDPYLDFDYHTLGSTVNFFSQKEIFNFYRQMKSIKSEGNEYCLSSIVKSHFPITLLGKKVYNSLKIIYIYRNPVEVFISFWKYLNSISYFLGPKADSPLATALSTPCGYSQRYQLKNYKNYFERWAMHVSDAFLLAKKNDYINMVSFSELINNHSKIIKETCQSLEIKLIKNPSIPEKVNYFSGAKLEASDSEKEILYNYCFNEIRKYNDLPIDII